MSQEADKALILADSYLEEVRNKLPDDDFALITDLPDVDQSLIYRNLKAAKKQIDKIQQIDPNHKTFKEIEGGNILPICLPEVEVDYLFYKGFVQKNSPHQLLHRLKALNHLKKAEDIMTKKPDIFSGPHPLQVPLYQLMAEVYLQMGQKGKALESINKALEFPKETMKNGETMKNDLIQLEKMKGRVEDCSLIKMKIDSFYGNWKILFFLVGLTIFSLVSAVSAPGSAELAGVIFFSVIFGGLTWIYYFFYTR